MSTVDNLKEAFGGESKANRKYLAYAGAAEKQGLAQVAKLFRAAAEAETVHAMRDLEVMGAVGETSENLRAAIEGETQEFKEMYPRMIEEAEKEGNEEAASAFRHASAVEAIHASLYQRALDRLGENPEVDYYVCQYCGNTVEGEPPEKCPICGAPRSMFEKIN